MSVASQVSQSVSKPVVPYPVTSSPPIQWTSVSDASIGLDGGFGVGQGIFGNEQMAPTANVTGVMSWSLEGALASAAGSHASGYAISGTSSNIILTINYSQQARNITFNVAGISGSEEVEIVCDQVITATGTATIAGSGTTSVTLSGTGSAAVSIVGSTAGFTIDLSGGTFVTVDSFDYEYGYFEPPSHVTLSRSAISTALNTTSYDAFPGIAEASNGDLVAVFFSGSGHDTRDAVIKQIVSDDNGATWGASSTISGAATTNVREYRDPSITTLANGTLYASWLQWDTVDTRKILHFTSSDNGDNWTSRGDTTVGGADDVITATSPHQLSNGDLVNFCFAGESPTLSAYFYKSTDNGETWSTPVLVASPAGGESYVEHGIVEIDGILIALIRENTHANSYSDTVGKLYRTTSSNSGATWSTFEDVTPVGWRRCKPCLYVMESNVLLMASRKISADLGGIVFASNDRGKTWNPAYDLSKNEFEYGDWVLNDSKIKFFYSTESSGTDADLYLETLVEN